MPDKITGEEGTKQFKVNWDAEQLATGKFKINVKVRADSNEEAEGLMANGLDRIQAVLKEKGFELTEGKK
jgi:hypothetical protein